MRLLQLPLDIQQHVIDHKLSMGHARALLALEDPAPQRKVCEAVLARGLSVRETERLVAKAAQDRPASTPMDPDLLELQDRLCARFRSPVRLRRTGDKGTITITFHNQDEFTRLLQDLGLGADEYDG